jgi:hypothetical protein
MHLSKFYARSLYFLLLIGLFSCRKEDYNFETGRYEYAGIDNKEVRFFRVEAGEQFRQVFPVKKTGFGELLTVPFCDEQLFASLFYDCGLYPELEKPYFEFDQSKVNIAVLSTDSIGFIEKYTFIYKIVGDSIAIGNDPDYVKFLKPSLAKTHDLGFNWRIWLDAKIGSYNAELLEKNYTDLEHLKIIKKSDKLIVGDTIALWLFRERFVKK